MTWWTWASIGYGVVALLVLRPIAGHFAWKRTYRKPDGEDWWFGTWTAIGVILVWWAIGIMLGYLKVCKRVRIGAEREGERELEREETSRRLAQLERETGLK